MANNSNQTYAIGRVDVEPIKWKDMQEMMRLCLVHRDNAKKNSHEYFRWYRNYIMLALGINTGARISTLLHLTPKHINGGCVRITESKTGKTQKYELNKDVYDLIKSYIDEMEIGQYEFIFRTYRKTSKPMTRVQAYNIIQKLKKEVGIDYNVGCHSLRKSFGRYIYDQENNIYVVQRLLGHSTTRVTEQYICVNDTAIDKVRKNAKFII